MQAIGTEQAKLAAKRLFGYFPEGAATDQKVFTVGVVQLLAEYPVAAIETILSPLSGLPSRHKFLPSIAEIKQALEEQTIPIRKREQEERAEQARRNWNAQPRLPAPEMLPPEPRPTIDELKAKYGENFGLSAAPKGKGKPTAFRPLSELLKDAGISQEQFDKQQKEAREALRRAQW